MEEKPTGGSKAQMQSVWEGTHVVWSPVLSADHANYTNSKKAEEIIIKQLFRHLFDLFRNFHFMSVGQKYGPWSSPWYER